MLHKQEVRLTFATAKKISSLQKIGELPEWLMEQFAKLSTGNCRKGSNPLLSAYFFLGV